MNDDAKAEHLDKLINDNPDTNLGVYGLHIHSDYDDIKNAILDSNGYPIDGEDEDWNPEYKPWWYAFTTVRYILYIIFAAVPYTALGFCLVATNFIINIFLNDGWAEGNLWLLANTAYLVFQYLVGLPIFWEIDPYMLYMKWFRFIDLLTIPINLSIFYTGLMVMFGVLEDWDNSEVTYTSIYTVMVLSYNLMMHLPILPINLLIVLKELSMEFMQFANNLAGTEFDDWSLGLANFINMFRFVFDIVNPWWWQSDEEWFW